MPEEGFPSQGWKKNHFKEVEEAVTPSLQRHWLDHLLPQGQVPVASSSRSCRVGAGAEVMAAGGAQLDEGMCYVLVSGKEKGK